MIIHWMLFDVRCSIHYVQIKMSSFNRKKKFSFKWNVKTSYVYMMEKKNHAHFNLFYSHNKFFIYYCRNGIESFTCVCVNGKVCVVFALSFFSSGMYVRCVCVYAPFTFFYYSPNLFYLSQNVLWMSCLSHSTVWLWQKYRWFNTGE